MITRTKLILSGKNFFITYNFSHINSQLYSCKRERKREREKDGKRDKRNHERDSLNVSNIREKKNEEKRERQIEIIELLIRQNKEN